MSTLPTERFDVIVVGAGPAGVTAAVALGKAGYSVLLCEAGVYPGAENWSGAVYFAENIEHPEAFGADVVAAAPYERRVVERGAYLYNGHSLLGASLRSPDVFRSCYTVLRPVYDRYLAEVSREHGVVLACETTVQSLIRHRGRVIGVHTERGVAYADVVFLAEGDASHLVTQEGYERVSEQEQAEGAPHFLQGVKEVISLPQGALEERFGLGDGEGAAYEMLLRNASRRGRTVPLNMGGFLYTNRDSISLGFVLPLDNLAHHFEGDHNLLMEWFKALPEIERLIDGGELTSYGAKIIRGGGLREIPRLVDDGLAIGGAASGVGLDFPYPNFTGPATAMGLWFAQAVQQIGADHGGPGRGGDPTSSPFTETALRETYLRQVKASHYYRNVEALRDWPGYIERTRFFFEKQLDVVNNAAFVMSRPGRLAPLRWWDLTRLLRRAIPRSQRGAVLADNRALAATVGLGRMVRAAITPANVARVAWNTIGALLPGGGRTRMGAEHPDGAVAGAGVAEARAHDGSRLRAIYRVDAGRQEAGRAPWLLRWYWRRFGSALASAFSEVYTNDDTDIAAKLDAAARHVGGRFALWDLLVAAGGAIVLGSMAGKQAVSEWFQHSVLRWDPSRFRDQLASRLLLENRERIRLDDSTVTVSTPYDTKLGTITYQEGHHSHIKVMWPRAVEKHTDLSTSALWNICPAKVYEVRRNRSGQPGVVVNFENCIKCETCWRGTGDVHWSRATQQRLIYQVYTPAQRQLHDYLDARAEPRPRLGSQPGFWEALADRDVSPPSGVGASVAVAVAALRVRLERADAALRGYAADLARSPLALEEGRRHHLRALLGAASEAFDDAFGVWQSASLDSVREAAGKGLAEVWDDALERFEQMRGHAARQRFFWAEVLGKQLQDHHFRGLQAACDRVSQGLEISRQASHDRTVDEWLASIRWRAREAERGRFDRLRATLRVRRDELFGTQAVRALEHGDELSPEQRAWLRSEVDAALATDAEGYGRRDVLVEELAACDPALAYAVSSHLLGSDLLAAAGAGDAVGDGWLAAVVGGLRTVDSESRLDVVADFVPTALADTLVVVAGGHAHLLPVDAEEIVVEDVGTVGLIGARVRRLRIEGFQVAADRRFELGAALDPVTLDEPAAGEPWAPVLALGLRDYLATVRGAGDYLLGRARDHAAGRVQFPGAFEDEAGRDTIAKFGAVKQMLAEMEAHRYVLEAVSLEDPAADDEWTGMAAAKVIASDAFGPGDASFTYNTGQLFGGTAFSEDDVIAKFYRDSAPYRFLLGHDDALRVAIGRRRAAAVAAGSPLVPFADADERALERACDHPLLGEAGERFVTAREQLEAWIADHSGTAGDATLHAVGGAVVRALGAKAALLRAVRRLEAGIPTAAIIDAATLVVDRFAADAPALVAEAELGAAALEVGDDLLSGGDLFPPPAIADAGSYDAIVAADQPHGSGEWLQGAFDAERLRYVPEILGNDDRLRTYWETLEGEFRERFAEPRFDGLIYSRYLEKLHLIPSTDLDYMVERGFMRMPIAADLGGEEALKAEYYILCMLIGRYGDAALSLAIMANTSIGTTPTLIGLYQDLPRAHAELQKVRDNPATLGDIHDRLDRLLSMMQRPDLAALTAAYTDLAGLVTRRVVKSMVLKYIGAGFLRAFFAAGQAGKRRDLDGFEGGLRQARELIDGILEGVGERLREYPRRQRAHEQFLRMISAGYISAFALTEPTAGSDSGGVKTFARAQRRTLHRDDDGVLWFWLDEDGERERRNLIDADRLEFDYEGSRLLYRYADDQPPAPIDHSEYDYEHDDPAAMRFYMHGSRKVPFTDIAQVREADDGALLYEFWVLNGAKMWITNGRFCHCMALYATTEPEGVTGFMVDRHTEGMVVGADEEKLGQRGSPTNELSLNNVRVPREMILGFRGRGQVNALETLNTGRAGLCVTTHATIQEMVEDALPYLRGDRSALLAPSSNGGARPLERLWMARLAEELVGTAATTYELIGLLDNKQTRSVRMESAVGKYYGSEAQHACVDWMERLRGLEGQTWVHRIEKTRRDARVLNIYEGTNEVQRFLLLKDLVQRVMPAWESEGATRSDGDDSSEPYADLIDSLEDAKASLRGHLKAAVARFGQLVWANVGMQPCFFRLAEIAGTTKVIDAAIYRLCWCATHDVPTAHRQRLERATRLYVRRALIRIGVLERRYAQAFERLCDGRYPVETQLGFQSLEIGGAQAEGWGLLPAALAPAPPLAPLSAPVDIAVLLKPVPTHAPRPRVEDGTFREPLCAINPADRAALAAALELKRRDPERVRVHAITVAGPDGRWALREALAHGADAGVHLDTRGTPEEVRHDGRYVAEAVAGYLGRSPAAIVLCGHSAADTEQGVVPSFLGALRGHDVYSGVEWLDWTDGAEPRLRLGAAGWQGRDLESAPECVIALTPESDLDDYRLAAWLAAADAEIDTHSAADLVAGLVPLSVRHERREVTSARVGSGERATTVEVAVDVLLGVAGGSGSGASDAAVPYAERMFGLGEQPHDDAQSCVLLLQPCRDELSGAARSEIDAAARLAAGVGLPLDVIVPVSAAADDAAAARVVGGVVEAAAIRRVYAVVHPRIDGFATAGHLEWLEELWAMYRGRPQWLVGPQWANDLLARFAANGAPQVDSGRCWSWHNVESLSNGGGSIRVATGIYGGTARAVAELPAAEGLRVLTLGPGAAVSIGAGEPGAGGLSAVAPPAVYAWQPELSYDVDRDPVASLFASLASGDGGLEEADFIIDFGYGAGGREGLEELAEPLRRLLAEEMGLGGVMIGATRKVTQDLELLPADRQIGQTGVSVNPKLIIALAVSGAPQHVDYIGERAVILSFNVDPEAPLMKLNSQRPKPIVHPIVGDVRETVPRFIEAVRARLKR